MRQDELYAQNKVFQYLNVRGCSCCT